MVAEPGCDMPWRAPQKQVSKRICEQIVDVQMVEQLVKLLNTESQDRIQRFEDKTVEVRQSQIVEKIDETPEIQTVQEHSAVLAQLALRISGDWRGSVREGEGFHHRIDQPVTEGSFGRRHCEALIHI